MNERDDIGQGSTGAIPSRYEIPEVLVRHDPHEATLAPVVLDSPHSGSHYPEDFRHAAPIEAVRRVEDALVDELFAQAPYHGAPLLAALFPRSYIDPNRHEADIEPGLLADAWPHDLKPSARSERGLGLIRSLLRPDLPLYDRRLTSAEVVRRIERYHRPYHAELKRLLDRAAARFGAVWHVNCHSMKAAGRGRASRSSPRADMVLGDGDGRTCDSDFPQLVRERLEDLGYSVRLNDPFKGAELVHRYSDPVGGRHSLQIEVNRRLYFDAETLRPTEGFAALKADLGRLIATVADYARAQAPKKGLTAGTVRPGSVPRDCARDRTGA
jgi:N-formylglutamate amidohydrolase